MKLSLAALAAVGVDGCKYFEHSSQKNWKVEAVNAVYKPLFGGHIEDAVCDVKPVHEQNGKWWLKLTRTAHIEGMKALYKTEDNIVNEDCWGDWIIPAWKPIHSAFHKMHEDFFSVTYDEWAAAGTAWLDISFKNQDACQQRYIYDHISHWCLENEGVCFRQEGIFGRIYDNIFDLGMHWFAQWKLLKTNDLCYTDDQMIDVYAAAWGNMCHNAVLIHGLELPKYGTEFHDEHITTSAFKKEKKHYKKTHHPFLEKASSFVLKEVSSMMK